MKILVNGEAREVTPGTKISELLAELDLEPVRVALELNRKLVVRADHPKTELNEADRVEIVTLVGGG